MKHPRLNLKSQEGFTLVEVIIVMAMGLALMYAGMSILGSHQKLASLEKPKPDLIDLMRDTIIETRVQAFTELPPVGKCRVKLYYGAKQLYYMMDVPLGDSQCNTNTAPAINTFKIVVTPKAQGDLVVNYTPAEFLKQPKYATQPLVIFNIVGLYAKGPGASNFYALAATVFKR